ncbi:hypothetical protein MTsDn1_22070 [Alteromonas sp. MTD1]|jgi:uncharacterized SAM-binding protein YcdF (DUF218 family)
MLIAKQLAMFLVSPLCLSICLLLLNILMLKRNKLSAVKTFNIVALSLLLVFSQPWVADLVLNPLEFQSASTEAKEIQPDYIFVPACYYHTEGNVPTITRWHECSLQRMLEAIKQQKKLEVPIVLTGGKFLQNKDVVFAREAEKFLHTFGVNHNNIIVIEAGWNTKSEVISLKEHLPDARVVAISSATHQIRLSYLLSDAGIEHTISAVDYHSSGDLSFYIVPPSSNALIKIQRAAYEYLALLKYFLYDSSSEEIR